MNKIKSIIGDSIITKEKLLSGGVSSKIEEIVNVCVNALKNGNSIYWCGNGGSAADAQHLAAELSGRFYYDRDPLPSEALHCNTSYITAVGNDYSYDVIYSRLIKGIGRYGDILIGLSTSGKSKNVVKAFEECQNKGILTVGLTGDNTNDFDICDFIINVPSSDTPRIQESHILIGHIICQLIEEEIYPR
jgi:D-sedoheptulose 7-phosphate isomerase